MTTNKKEFNKRHKKPQDKSHTLESISKLSNIKKSTLQEVRDRGIGAYKTNPQSVRMKDTYKKNVNAPLSKKLSKEQWAMARVYSFVNKIEGPRKLNHDKDLVPKKYNRNKV
jgi:hypothetical protein